MNEFFYCLTTALLFVGVPHATFRAREASSVRGQAGYLVYAVLSGVCFVWFANEGLK